MKDATKIVIKFPMKKESNFVPKMNDGETRTFELKESIIHEKLVQQFTNNLPDGIAKKPWEELTTKQQKLVTELEPDKWADGNPKEKFQHRLELVFTEIITGWDFKYDAKFYLHEDYRPTKKLYELIEAVKGPITGEFELGSMIPIGAWFDAEVYSKEVNGKNYMHLNPDTLRPHIGTQDEKPETRQATDFTPEEQKLLEFLVGPGAGMEVYDIGELEGYATGPEETIKLWTSITKKVKSFKTNDNKIAIVL